MLYLLLPLDCWGGFLITSYHFPILNASVRFLGFCAWWTHGCLALGYKWVALRWTHEAGKLCPVDALAIVMWFHLTSGPVLSMIGCNACRSQVLPPWMAESELFLAPKLRVQTHVRESNLMQPHFAVQMRVRHLSTFYWKILILGLPMTPTPVSHLWRSKSTSIGPW